MFTQQERHQQIIDRMKFYLSVNLVVSLSENPTPTLLPMSTWWDRVHSPSLRYFEVAKYINKIRGGVI